MSDSKSDHHKHSQKLKKRLLGATLALAVLVACLGLIYSATTKQQFTPEYKMQKALDVKTDNKNLETIRSNYKFSITYDNRQFTAGAYIISDGGKNFTVVTGKDLLKTEDYSLVTIYDKRTKSKDRKTLVQSSLSEFTLTTNIHSDFFEKHKNDFGPGKSQLELTSLYFAPKSDDLTTYELKSKRDVTINGIKYLKVTYLATSKKYLTTQSNTEAYFTVQNGKPYAIKISNITNKDIDFVGSLKALIRNVSYGDATKKSYGTTNAGEKGVVKPSSTVDGANIPYFLEDGTALQVAAKNQPATVRIANNYCADITLLSPNKTPYMTVKDACSPIIGSGSIVSNDGYISTNGHVTVQTPASALMVGLMINPDFTNLSKYLQYLVDSNILSANYINSLISSAKSGDNEAVQKIAYSTELIPRDRIITNNVVSEYAVQLANNPIKAKLAGTKFNLQYTADVVKAKFIDADYNPFSGNEGKFNLENSLSSDVAILKIDGNKFPIVNLGSIESLNKGDLITAIGFPGFVDGGIDTKLKNTVPTVTQGSVRQIGYDSPLKIRKIVGSSTPIAGGNSGGPAFSVNGLAVGLNTYGSSGCNDQKCFDTYSVFRDIADYKALLKRNKINLQGSTLAEQWSSGIDSFSKGNYRKSLKDFKSVQSQYPQFYLASSFINQAQEGVNAQNKRLMQIGICVLFGLIVVVVIVFIIVTLVKLKKHHSSPPVASPQAPNSTNAPVQQSPPDMHATPSTPTTPAATQTINLPQPNDLASAQNIKQSNSVALNQNIPEQNSINQPIIITPTQNINSQNANMPTPSSPNNPETESNSSTPPPAA